jgi:transposase-like protein
MGLFCRETRQYIIIPVANRRRETLLAVIAKHVIPGSTIYSDNWSGYFNLQTHPK